MTNHPEHTETPRFIFLHEVRLASPSNELIVIDTSEEISAATNPQADEPDPQ